jgi:Mg-chelatase subunit ChlD
MSTALVPGSLGAIAEQNGKSLAETFLSADAIVIVDVSGSMDENDARGGQTRYNVACTELARLQRDLPGKVAVVGFSSWVNFEPTGKPIFQGGGTNLAEALRFVHPADGCVKFILISDGEPDNQAEALQVARTFTSKIDVVYVGPEGSIYGGQEFLRKLAAATGGRYVVAEKAQELAERVETLLLKAG